MELLIRSLAPELAEPPPVEMVERKGTGHPDTICDAVAEAFSRELCRFYLERFGRILHHNVDKVLLWGGTSRPRLGGGEVVAPLEIFLAGRATGEHKGVRVPLEELARRACTGWIREHLRWLDPERHVRLHCLVRPGSEELIEVFGKARANDSSLGVGYAPLSPLERCVLAVERRLNSREVKAEAPELGEDIKVLGLRADRRTRLTVACAFVDARVPDRDAYLQGKARAARLAREVAQSTLGGEIEVEVNAADAPEHDQLYLTVTGTSAEAGDDGEAGRGNRAHGLITPYRPMTLESLAGKNPVTHVGKLYNVCARLVAEDAVRELDELAAVQIALASRIGQPVADPVLVDVQAAPRPGAKLEPLVEPLRRIVGRHLEGFDALTARLVAGSVELF
jgi:S-adenosylmethionine synthetase